MSGRAGRAGLGLDRRGGRPHMACARVNILCPASLGGDSRPGLSGGVRGSDARTPGQLRSAVNQRREQVGLIIRDHALEHCRHPLQPHACINRRLGQRMQLPGSVPVELHEHQIPNLDVPPAIAGERAIRVTLLGRRRTHIVVDLAARPARAGIAHLPEIVFQSHLVDTGFLHALRGPQVVSLDIALDATFAFENCYVKFFLRNPEPLLGSDQLPRIGDSILLEVITKGKISQHLEKRVMPVGEPYILQIVVLAAGAYTFLRSRRARVVALLQS